MVGDALGVALGDTLGDTLGKALGKSVGDALGDAVVGDAVVGSAVGVVVVGASLGDWVVGVVVGDGEHKLLVHTGWSSYAQPAPVQLLSHSVSDSASHSCAACVKVYSRGGMPARQPLSLLSSTLRTQPALPLLASQHCAAMTAPCTRVVLAAVTHVLAGHFCPPPSSTSMGENSVGEAVGNETGNELG